MCELAVEDSDWLAVCGWDALQKGYMRTAENVKVVESILTQAFGVKITCYWLVGADHGIRLKLWTKNNVQIVAVGREGHTHEIRSQVSQAPSSFLFIEKELQNVSSTLIRERLRNGQSLEGLVHPKVEKYLIAHCKKT